MYENDLNIAKNIFEKISFEKIKPQLCVFLKTFSNMVSFFAELVEVMTND